MNVVKLETKSKNEFIDITSLLKSEVASKNLNSAVLLVYIPHTTACVTINESYDPDVAYDILSSMQKLVPEDFHYKHREGNSPSHIKSGLFGNQLLIPISDGQLMLGRWQGVFFCEYDGPRSRKIYTEFIKTV